jgi:hypothetical protein
VRQFWVASRHSLVVASYPPCPFPRWAPCHRYRCSTSNPPHEQLLVGLEAGGALSSVVRNSFIVLCCLFVVICCLLSVVCCLSYVVRLLLSVICRMSFVPRRSLSVVHCLFLVIHCLSYVICSSSSVVCRMSFVCHHQSSVDWRPLSLPIHPASSGSQRQG